MTDPSGQHQASRHGRAAGISGGAATRAQRDATNAAVALAELLRRRRNAQALVSQNRLSKAAAEQAVARWCGIAAWFGAVLPAELRRYETHQTWFDHAPNGMQLDQWRTEIARQLRRDTEAALAKAEAAPLPDAGGVGGGPVDRARALLALDNHLSLAAGLPPIGAEQSEERKAA